MSSAAQKNSPYQSIKNCWYVVGLSKEFKPETLTGHKIAGKVMVIWRTKGGEMTALDNRCAHKRFPLSEGKLLDDGTLECAYHGLCYNAKGKCTSIPSQPNQEIPPQAMVKEIPIIEQDGLVWVWPGDPAKKDTRQPPRTPELADPAHESIDSGPMKTPANYLLLIENLLDITHFYPLHDGNIGDIENSKIPIKYEESEENGNKSVKTIREVWNYNQPSYLQDWFIYDVVDRLHTHQMVSPGHTRVEMHNAPPGELGTDKERGYVLYHFHTPIDDHNHIWWYCINCKADHLSAGKPNMSTAKRVAEMFPDVVAQDHYALEQQQAMFNIPDDGYSELFLKPDKALRRARQIFQQMLREEAPSAQSSEAVE
jgi:phenylpropionate dioxygenase-like ring-hydroxylating dioxygenase large terminal subunit